MSSSSDCSSEGISSPSWPPFVVVSITAMASLLRQAKRPPKSMQMMHQTFSPFLLLCLLDSIRALIASNERTTLVDFFSMIPGWVDDASDPCSSSGNWNGVTCNGASKTQSVTKLVMSKMGLTGTIPVSVKELSSLVELDLDINSLSGTIPSDVFSCSTSLEQVWLNNNKLSGTVPVTIAQGVATTATLRNVDLSYNSLSGTLPYGMRFLQALVYFHVQFNNLTGQIPELASPLQSSLDLNDNLFNGTLPVSLGFMTVLQSLDVANNKLWGTLPDSFLQLVQLFYLDVDNNQLSGYIPDISSLHLSYLSMAGNHFFCPVPPPCN